MPVSDKKICNLIISWNSVISTLPRDSQQTSVWQVEVPYSLPVSLHSSVNSLECKGHRLIKLAVCTSLSSTYISISQSGVFGAASACLWLVVCILDTVFSFAVTPTVFPVIDFAPSVPTSVHLFHSVWLFIKNWSNVGIRESVVLPILDRRRRRWKLVRLSPFSVNAVSRGKIADDFQDNLVDTATLSVSGHLEGTVSEFWREVSKHCPSLGRTVVNTLLPFGAACLYERLFVPWHRTWSLPYLQC